MLVSDLVSDLLADDSPQQPNVVAQSRPKSPANRPAKIVAALDESPPSPQSPGVDGKRESGDPWPGLYRAWLSGIHEERVLLTLDDHQTREAIAAGAVSRDLARASVLLVVKVPKGDAGPGAVGLLAVPRDRWANFSPMAAIAALQAWH